MTAVAEAPNVASIPLALIKDAPNPRRIFDKTADAELTASIKEVGVLQPILVRKVGDAYELIAGSRRLRAARALRHVGIPAHVRTMTDPEARVAQSVENLQRRDLTPLEEADGFAALLTEQRLSLDEVAVAVAKPLGYVRRRLLLAQLVPDARKALEKGSITLGVANEIARLQPPDQVRILKVALGGDPYSNEPMSVQRVRNEINAQVFRRLVGAPFDVKDATLNPERGACTTCPFNTANDTDLFGDVASNAATCTDPACFASKCATNATRVVTQLTKKAEAKKAPAPVQLTELYNAPKGSPLLAASAYTQIASKADRCKATTTGVVMDGYRPGTVLDICTDPKCKVHGRDAAIARSNERAKTDDKAKEKAMKKRRAELAAIFTAALAEMPDAPRLPRPWMTVLRVVAASLGSDIWNEYAKGVVRDFAIPEPKNGKVDDLFAFAVSGNQNGIAIARHAIDIPDPEVWKLLARLAFAKDLRPASYDSKGGKGVEAFATLAAGVRAKKLIEQAKATVAEAPVQPKKKAAAKKAK